MGLLIVVVLILAVFGGLPQVGFHNYGYVPSGGIGLLLVILLILYVAGVLR